jgi:hypothetical protein
MSVSLFSPVRENYKLLIVEINRSILLSKPHYKRYKINLMSDDVRQIAYSFIYEVVSKIFRTGAAIYTAVMVARSTGRW